MELSSKQQAIELIKKAQKILLVTHKNPDGDAIGSILALQAALQTLGKEVVAVCPCAAMPDNMKFLNGVDKLQFDIEASKDFVITLDTTEAEVQKLGYKQKPEDHKLNIVITLSSGNLKPEHISFGKPAASFDLAIVLDSPDLERLGEFFDQHTEMFYEIPLVNIDHHPSNDYFGKVNWVDIAATSTCEILVALLEALGQGNQLFNEGVATALLTGIITDTGSFQNVNTTPKSFTVAAQLVALGARQQDIITSIFRTKSIATLRIWGKVLTNLKDEGRLRFVWSTASKDEMKEAGALQGEVGGVVDELLKSVPDTDFSLLITERNGNVHGSLRAAKKNIDVATIAGMFGGGGHPQAAAFDIKDGRGLEDVAHDVISRIRTYQSNRV